MLNALIVTALLESATFGTGSMICLFQADEPDKPPIEVAMTARPSLKDLPGLYRVLLKIDGKGIKGAAQPILATESRDVLIRATPGNDLHYTVGFDDTGMAAMNIVHQKAGADERSISTLRGNCRNYERYIHTWSTN